MKSINLQNFKFLKIPFSNIFVFIFLFFINSLNTSAQVNNLPLAAHYPLLEDLNDVTSNFGPGFVSGTAAPTIGNPLCLDNETFPYDYFQTPFFSDLDWTNFGYSIEVNVEAYPVDNFPTFNFGGPIFVTSTSFRNSGIYLGEGGELGILYNNSSLEFSNIILNLNQWYEIEFYFENETAYLYLDGVLVFSYNTGPLQTSVVIGSSTINADKTISTRHGGGLGSGFDKCVRNAKVYFIPSCTPSITCPNPETFECGDDAAINAWLASATTETCTLTGTTVTNNYDAANFSGCNSTGNITFSLRNSAGQVIADCVTSLTIDDNTPPSVVCPTDVTVECGDPTNAGGGGSSLLITEADPNTPDFIEIQNFSNNTEDYTGWFVAISNSYSNINISNSIVWELGLIAPNEILYKTDNSGNNPWGNNIFWNSSDPSWALLIDNNGEVADAVFWGWSAADIASFNSTINSVNVTIPTSAWSGDGISGTCPSPDSRNRQGTSDNNDASDWFCSLSTIGTANPSLNISGGSGGGIGGGLPSATATDGCDESPSVSFTDVFTPDANCPQAGVITRTWIATDACGNVSTSCDQTITINPPLAPTVTAPTLPTMLSCQEAEAFIVPEATYTNGLTDDCELTGTISGTVTSSSNINCSGGILTINYSGEDACGNILTAGPFTIEVEPAPPAVLSPGAYASPISCEDANNFSIGDATFTNGLTGACGNNGTIAAQFNNNFDVCGGNITVYYYGQDECGNSISLDPIVIEVQPAPLPMITLPSLPTSLSCADGETYMPPTASFDNGLAGPCNISGTADFAINRFFDACGGYLQIIYLGEDQCGRSLVKSTAVIDVDPAPAPTIALPDLPVSLSCSEASMFAAPITSYDNGEGGDCNISGLLEATVSYDVDACNGGTISVMYEGTDDCGNVLSSTPIEILVTPAAAATLDAPKNVPSIINCLDASSGYYPGNAIYANEESNSCENSGEIEGVIIESWNNCDGGFIIYEYSGVDDCGNELTPVEVVVAVLPDTWAPEGGCAPLSETMNSIEDVPEPDELDYYLGQIAAGYDDAGCGEVVVTVIDDSGAPVCNGNDSYERIYTVEIADDCGNVAGECSITFSGSCSLDLCTMDQKFYGNPDASINGQSSGEIIEMLIAGGTNPIVIGDGSDCGFMIDDLTCVQAMLNSSGAATSLSSGFVTDCFDVNNSLINQMVVTTLNIRYNETMNSNGQINFGGLLLSEACLNVPGYMLNNLPDNPTVSDLLQYANDFIACQCSSTCGEFLPNMAELTNLFWGLNSRFNNCNAPAPCGSDFAEPNGLDQSYLTNDLSNSSFEIYPNPTNDLINIDLVNGFGKSCTIEIFDSRGAKVGEKIYNDLDQGTLQLNVQEYGNGIYWMTIKLDGLDQMTKRFMVVK